MKNSSIPTNDEESTLHENVYHHLDKIENILETYCCKGNFDDTTIPFLIDCNGIPMCFPPPTVYDSEEQKEETVKIEQEDENWNNSYKDIILFKPTNVVYHDKPIEEVMRNLDDIEHEQLLHYAQRIHRTDIYSNYYNPSLKEKEEIKHLHSLFYNKNDIHKIKKCDDQVLLKQGSVIISQITPDDGKLYHLLLYSRFMIIASYQERKEHEYTFKLEHFFPKEEIQCIIDLGLVQYNTIKIPSKKMSISKWFTSKKKKKYTDDESTSLESTSSTPQEYHGSSFAIITKSGFFICKCDTPLHNILWLDAFSQMMQEDYIKICKINLYSACYLGDVNMLQRIIKCYDKDISKIINMTDEYGNTPLHYSQHHSITKCLLDMGANPNIPDRDGFTCVDYAISKNDKRTLQMLVANGGVVKSCKDDAVKQNIMQMKKRSSKLYDVQRKTSDLNERALEYRSLSSTLAKEIRNKYK